VKHADEDGTLEWKFEAAGSKQLVDHSAAPGVLPKPAEQQRCADTLAAETIEITGVELREDDRALGVAADRGGQAFEFARGNDGVLPAEVLDDALFGAAVLAHALDEVKVGVAVDALFADEHAELAPDDDAIRQVKWAVCPHYLALQDFRDPRAPQTNQWFMPRVPAKIGVWCSTWVKVRPLSSSTRAVASNL